MENRQQNVEILDQEKKEQAIALLDLVLKPVKNLSEIEIEEVKKGKVQLENEFGIMPVKYIQKKQHEAGRQSDEMTRKLIGKSKAEMREAVTEMKTGEVDKETAEVLAAMDIKLESFEIKIIDKTAVDNKAKTPQPQLEIDPGVQHAYDAAQQMEMSARFTLYRGILTQLNKRMMSGNPTEREIRLYERVSVEMKSSQQKKPEAVWYNWKKMSESGKLISTDMVESEMQRLQDDKFVGEAEKTRLLEQLEMKMVFAELHNFKLKIETGLDGLDGATEQTYVDNMGNRMVLLARLGDESGISFNEYLGCADVALKEYMASKGETFGNIYSEEFNDLLKASTKRYLRSRRVDLTDVNDDSTLEGRHFDAFLKAAVDMLIVTGQAARVALPIESTYDSNVGRNKFAVPMPKDGVRGDAFRLPMNWNKVNAVKHPDLWRGTQGIQKRSMTFFEYMQDKGMINLNETSEFSENCINAVQIEPDDRVLDIGNVDMNKAYKEWFVMIKGAATVAKTESDMMVAPSQLNPDKWLENAKFYLINSVPVNNDERLEGIVAFMQWVVDLSEDEAINRYKIFTTPTQFFKYKETIAKSDETRIAVGAAQHAQKQAVGILLGPLVSLSNAFSRMIGLKK